MDNPTPVIRTAGEVRREQRKRKLQRPIRNLFVSDLESFIQGPYLHPTISDNSNVLADTDFDGSDYPFLAKEYLQESSFDGYSPYVDDEIDTEEIYDLIRNLIDPEHPLTLEQLCVVSRDLIEVDHERAYVRVYFTPSIPHCSQATLIGLMIRVKLLRCLPTKFKTDVLITPGTHNTEDAINKQLNDKERVAAALENPAVLRVINCGLLEVDLAKWSLLE